MMHKWESQEKLISIWQAQQVDEGLYRDFEFDRAEFDNVPPVVPRFLFYLQLSLKPLIAQMAAEQQKLQTADLKA